MDSPAPPGSTCMRDARPVEIAGGLLPPAGRPINKRLLVMSLKQVQLIVRGRVQGVFFRASTQREARRLGLTGWVKNRADSTVEILAEGEEDGLKDLIAWANRGPSASRVERVDVRWRSFSGEFPDFRIVD